MTSNEQMALIQYLADGRPFLEVVEAVFFECRRYMEIDCLCLYQITTNPLMVRCIAGDERVKDIESDSEDIPVSKLPYLQDRVVRVKDNEKGNMIAFPIFLRNTIAMHIVASRKSSEFSDAEFQEWAQITLILQGVAMERNFTDSLQYSYRFLESAIDRIPLGLAVMTPDCKSFLLMNQVAVENKGVQNIIRKAATLYRENQTSDIEELFDDETGLWYDASFHHTLWIDGNPALICTTIDITQKMKNQQKIEYQANNDYLTGLFNRMKCERDLTQLINRTVERGERGIVLFLDLDNFKQVNDGLGHQYGDVLLQEISNAVQSIPQLTNHCYRMGGDEFVILILPEYFDEITTIVDAISKRFNEPWDLMGVEYYCTMSMGLAIFPDHASHMQDIIKKADYAMYEAKKGGKNRYLWYMPEDPERAEKENMENAIQSMVGDECKDFILHYQPVVNEKGELMGAEALVRIDSPQFGELLPAEFLPMAEYLGLMNRIGNHVLSEACRQLSSWTKLFGEDFKMFINVSSTQLLQSKAVELILKAIEDSGASNSNVVLDVSEKIEFRDEDKAFSTLEILYAHGVSVAMDDFGSGRQSITMLQRMKASYIKFDKSFLKSGSDSILKEGVLSAVLHMAKAMNAQIGFVGVESEEEKEFALSHGATCIEGFYYGEPMASELFEERFGATTN